MILSDHDSKAIRSLCWTSAKVTCEAFASATHDIGTQAWLEV